MKFTLRYTAIQVTDLDRALDFYLSVLGMRLITRIKVPETKGEMAIVKSDGVDHWLEINWYADQEYHLGDELDHIAFEVADLDEAMSELKLKGIEPVSYVRESKNSRWTYIADPDGIWIEIFQKK
nr:VOC family protein [Candidatus Njordarchaeum guaymaensis]